MIEPILTYLVIKNDNSFERLSNNLAKNKINNKIKLLLGIKIPEKNILKC